MGKYEVLITRTDTTNLWVEVQASTQAEADNKALEWVEDEANEEAVSDLEHLSFGDWKVDKGFRCLDCGVDTSDINEYPTMLRDEVWHQIVPGGRGMLCRAHMEARLGRPLKEADYPPRIGSAEHMEQSWARAAEWGIPGGEVGRYREAFDLVMATNPPDHRTAMRRFEGVMGWEPAGWELPQNPGAQPGGSWICGRLSDALIGAKYGTD